LTGARLLSPRGPDRGAGSGPDGPASARPWYEIRVPGRLESRPGRVQQGQLTAPTDLTESHPPKDEGRRGTAGRPNADGVAVSESTHPVSQEAGESAVLADVVGVRPDPRALRLAGAVWSSPATSGRSPTAATSPIAPWLCSSDPARRWRRQHGWRHSPIRRISARSNSTTARRFPAWGTKRK
jgi:hypothetical protein